MTLRDLTDSEFLYDARTGHRIEDASGNPDRPEDYEVLNKHDDGSYTVRGPSGQTDRTTTADPAHLWRDGD